MMDCGVQLCPGTGIPDAEIRQYRGEARLFFLMVEFSLIVRSYSAYSYSYTPTNAMLEFDESPTRPSAVEARRLKEAWAMVCYIVVGFVSE